jgi:hypothetical protein
LADALAIRMQVVLSERIDRANECVDVIELPVEIRGIALRLGILPVARNA